MIRVNLLPHSNAKAARRAQSGGGGLVLDKMKIIPVSSLAVVLTGCLAVLMLQSAREKSLEHEVAVARAEAEKYKKTIALIDEMVRKENELNRRLDIVRQLDMNRFRTVTVLDEMAKRVPNYLWLTSVKEVAGNKLAIDGLAFSNLVISDLMTNLEGSNVFQDVDLSVAKRKEVEKQSVVGFTLTTAVAIAGMPGAKATDTKATDATLSVEDAAKEVKAAAAESSTPEPSSTPAGGAPASSGAPASDATPAAVGASAVSPANPAGGTATPVIQIPAAPPVGTAPDESPSGAGAETPAPAASSETAGG